VNDAKPIRYETRRDAYDGNVTRRRGLLHVFAVYAGEKGKTTEVEVPHNAMHSPDFMEQGYGGVGAEDLARTIIGHWLGEKDPNRLVYSRFKAMLVSPAPQLVPLRITAQQIEGFFKLAQQIEGGKK